MLEHVIHCSAFEILLMQNYFSVVVGGADDDGMNTFETMPRDSCNGSAFISFRSMQMRTILKCSGRSRHPRCARAVRPKQTEGVEPVPSGVYH